MTREEKNAAARARYAKNFEEHNAKARARYAAKADEYNLKARNRYAANSAERNLKARAWYAARHPKTALTPVGRLIFVSLLCQKILQQKEKILASIKAWRAFNPDRVRANVRSWHARKQQSDSSYRLVKNLRSRMYNTLKGYSKGARTLELLSMDLDEYRIYLQGQFLPGMTWENYGPVWHVDHIRPCAGFDFSDPLTRDAQLRECFNWSNTQPMFARDNIIKGDSSAHL